MSTIDYGIFGDRETLEAAARGAGITPEQALAQAAAHAARQATEQANEQTLQVAALAVQAYEEGDKTLPELRRDLEGAGQGEAFSLALGYIVQREKTELAEYGYDLSEEDEMLAELTPAEFEEHHRQELQAERDQLAGELHQAQVEQTRRDIAAFSAKVEGQSPAVVALVRQQLEAELASNGAVPDAATQDAIIEQAVRTAAAVDRKSAAIDSASEQLARIAKNQHSGFGGQFADDPAAREAFVAQRKIEAMETADFTPAELLPAPTAEEERVRQVERLREVTGAVERFQADAAEGRRKGQAGNASPLEHFEQSARDRNAAKERIRAVDERAVAPAVEPSESTKQFIAAHDRTGEHRPHHSDERPDDLGPAL